MLNLFRSIFHGSETGGDYPKKLVEEAIERAVDGTDPWLRGLNGYHRKLRPAVLAAIDHVVALVDGLAAPRAANRDSYARDPLLQAMFLSAEQMQQILQDQLSVHKVPTSPVYALLTMVLQQRGIFGADLQGDTIVRDVPQVTVSFAGHRLLDPAGDVNETRRLLKRRGFDHLLSLALRRMIATRERRRELDDRQTLLQSRLDLLQQGNWGFDPGTPQHPKKIAELEKQLAENHAQLQLVGNDDQSLQVALKLLIDVLSRPEQQLWAETRRLVVDRMGIRRAAPSDTASELQLELLHNAEGHSLVVTLVRIGL